MREFPFPQEIPNPVHEAAAKPELVPEEARIEVIGLEDPRLLTREQFEEQAWLFHGARNPDFRVDTNFDYQQDMVDDATLGGGLYTTTDKDLAERYALSRPNGTLWKLMPYQARMLNLTSNMETRNLSGPWKLVAEWIKYAAATLSERRKDPQVDWAVKKRLDDVLETMVMLQADMGTERFVDLRDDILGTRRTPFSMVDDVWKAFCAMKGIDGLIFIEGGGSELTRQNDRTHVFYNLSTIGTYDDWQRRAENQ